MKLLYWTDPHFTSMNLDVRRDDYPEALFTKAQRVMQLAIDEKVDLILCGGDLYHTKRIGKPYENRLIELLSDTPIRQACVVGNHDIYYDDPVTVSRGPLGTMFSAHVFDPQPPECLIEMDDCTLLMVPFTPKLEAFKVNSKKPVIIAAHCFLDKGWDDHFLPPELTNEADYILLGHDHVPYEMERRNRALIVRPGSLSRGTRHEPNWNRDVLVAIVDTVEQTARYEKIPCAAGDEIFSRERIQSEKTLQKARILEDLTTSVESGASVPDLLAAMQMPDDVRHRVIHWLTEAAII